MVLYGLTNKLRNYVIGKLVPGAESLELSPRQVDSPVDNLG
jgi:hypothetical protein